MMNHSKGPASFSRLRFKTIAEYHKKAGLPKPTHPLISLIHMGEVLPFDGGEKLDIIFDFYVISLKRMQNAIFKYGQQACDYDEGVLFFLAPGQLFSITIDRAGGHHPSGWMLLIHPDFLWNTLLAKTINQYEYFGYAVNEALHLSTKEEHILTEIVQNIQQEYNANLDNFSQNVIIAQLELLLVYSQRYYQRQFITRKKVNHELLIRFEDLISTYFSSGQLAIKGLPTVSYMAASLHVSPSYLSSLLRSLTGQSTQQHLHDKLIELAKQKLSTTTLTISEIAYELGFEHLASFSKLFKSQTKMTPLAFRQSFN